MIKEVYEDIKKIIRNYILYLFTKRKLEDQRFLVWVILLAMFLEGIIGSFVPASNTFANMFGLNYVYGMIILGMINALIVTGFIETVELVVRLIKKARKK